MSAFGLLVSANYSLMAVTSLTGLNCKSSAVSTFQELGVIIDFSKRSVTSAPLRVSAFAFSILPLCASAGANSDTRRILNRNTRSNTNREGSRSLSRDFLPVEARAPRSGRAPIARQFRSIKRARSTGRRFIRAKSLAPKCQESVARPACQHPISMLGEPRSRTFPFFTNTPGDARTPAKLSLFEPLPRRRNNKARATQMSRSHPLGGAPPVI